MGSAAGVTPVTGSLTGRVFKGREFVLDAVEFRPCRFNGGNRLLLGGNQTSIQLRVE